MAATTAVLPDLQIAAVKQGSGHTATTSIQKIAVPKPGPGQIVVKINWSGLCASDKSLLHDEWAPFGVAMQPATLGIAGHEGVGVVVAMSDDVRASGIWKDGDRAGVKWIASVCRACEFCRDTANAMEVCCAKQLNSGFTVAGTFQEYCLTDAHYATRIPAGVTDEEAGPIMCGGVTAYVACKRSGVRPGQWIVLPGAGGGLGHFAVQYAKAMGMRVIAIDEGEEKKQLCLQLGAEHFIDFKLTGDTVAEVTKLTGAGAHGVICFAATKAGYETAPNFLRPNGTLVGVGLPPDPTVLAGAPPIALCLKKLNIVGSVVGTLKDVDEALDFTARGIVRPVLTKGELKDLDELCNRMLAGKLKGRAVVKVSA